MDEEDEGSKFCEEDIDQILQRRTHTITIESEGKGSTFAKVKAEKPPEPFPIYSVFFQCFKCIIFSVGRQVLLQQGTEQTFRWRIQTSGRSGPKRRSLTWMPSMAGY